VQFNPKMLDLSHYDVVAPGGFKQVHAAGYRAVINKATEGPGMVDKTFLTRGPEVLQAGLLYGAYHFLRRGDPEEQANHFLEVAHKGGPTVFAKLELALDHEDPRVPLENAQQFMEAVHTAVGRYPLLYSGFLVKEQITRADYEFWSKVPLWLAQYSAHPSWPEQVWKEPRFIQFTGDGQGPEPHWVPGVKLPGGKGLDINHWGGTDDELAAIWARG
jgi:lysozyme